MFESQLRAIELIEHKLLIVHMHFFRPLLSCSSLASQGISGLRSSSTQLARYLRKYASIPESSCQPSDRANVALPYRSAQFTCTRFLNETFSSRATKPVMHSYVFRRSSICRRVRTDASKRPSDMSHLTASAARPRRRDSARGSDTQLMLNRHDDRRR